MEDVLNWFAQPRHVTIQITRPGDRAIANYRLGPGGLFGNAQPRQNKATARLPYQGKPYAPLEKRSSRWPVKPEITGSNPVWGALQRDNAALRPSSPGADSTTDRGAAHFTLFRKEPRRAGELITVVGWSARPGGSQSSKPRQCAGHSSSEQ